MRARVPVRVRVLALLCACACACAGLARVRVQAQSEDKPGACPPPSGLRACAFRCFGDGDCLGDAKCCKTLCGGSDCSRPVTAPAPRPPPPPAGASAGEGVCPPVSSTPWVCRSRCSSDGDCRRSPGLRCCQHRCGGYSCLRAVRLLPSAPDDLINPS